MRSQGPASPTASLYTGGRSERPPANQLGTYAARLHKLLQASWNSSKLVGEVAHLKTDDFSETLLSKPREGFLRFHPWWISCRALPTDAIPLLGSVMVGRNHFSRMDDVSMSPRKTKNIYKHQMKIKKLTSNQTSQQQNDLIFKRYPNTRSPDCNGEHAAYVEPCPKFNQEQNCHHCVDIVIIHQNMYASSNLICLP